MGPGSQSIGLDSVGDWGSMVGFFNTLGNPKLINREIKYQWRDWMRGYRWLLIRGLVTQGSAVGVSWPANARGSSSGIRSGNYRDALERLKISMRGNEVSMNFSKGDLLSKSHPGGAPLETYINYFEYGTSTQPPRPLWEPAYRKMGGEKKLAEIMLRAIKSSLNKQGYFNVKVTR